jgi:hypothetical protein
MRKPTGLAEKKKERVCCATRAHKSLLLIQGSSEFAELEIDIVDCN